MSLTKMGEVRFEILHLFDRRASLNVEVRTLIDSLTVKTKTQKWYVTISGHHAHYQARNAMQ